MITKKAPVLFGIFSMVFGIFLTYVLAVCIPDTQNNLPVFKMLILPVAWLAALSGLYLLGLRIEGFLEKYHRILLFAFLLCYAIVLYIICIRSRCIPDADYGSLYYGASGLAGLHDNVNWDYFAKYGNNTIPMVFVSLLLRAGRSLGFQDPYYFAVMFNVLQVTVSVYCIFYICQTYGNHKYVTAFLGAGMLAFSLPVIGHTQSLYTDALSFVYGIGAFCLWKRADEAGNAVDEGHEGAADKKTAALRRLGLTVAGLLWGIGISMKITVAISLIALFLYLFLSGGSKAVLKNISVPAAAGIVTVGLAVCAAGLPCGQIKEAYATPKFSYWMAIGMQGNGGYMDNLDYCFTLENLPDLEARKLYTHRYIAEHAEQFVSLRHLKAKARYNFANGGLGGSDFMRYSEQPNFFYDFISVSGKYFWRYSMIVTSYFYCLLLLIGIACFGHRILLGRGMLRSGIFVPLVSVFGIMLYVMLFEANNRQLYNHLPWFVCAAVMGMTVCHSLAAYGRE